MYRLLGDAASPSSACNTSSSPRSPAPAQPSYSTSPSVPHAARQPTAFTAGDRPHHYLSILCRPAEAGSCSTTPQTNWRSATPWQSHTTCGPTDSLRWPDTPEYPRRRGAGGAAACRPGFCWQTAPNNAWSGHGNDHTQVGMGSSPADPARSTQTADSTAPREDGTGTSVRAVAQISSCRVSASMWARVGWVSLTGS